MPTDERNELCLACAPELIRTTYKGSIKLLNTQDTECNEQDLRILRYNKPEEVKHLVYPCKIRYDESRPESSCTYFVGGGERKHTFGNPTFLVFQRDDCSKDSGPVSITEIYVKQKVQT